MLERGTSVDSKDISMGYLLMRWWGASLSLSLCLLTAQAVAGVPECGDIRLEDVGACEIRASVQCSASCDSIGVYKKSCATKLQKVCREECTLDAEPTCTDECTESCSEQCDLGVPITCTHNCFAECVGSCDASCEGAEDAERCHASCEATCDGECDAKCGAVVVGASCYKHCIECCGGSCGAQANMSCQTTCQDKEFESCEYALRADCDASCSGTGALFCDGEFVLAAEDAGACVRALSLRGIAGVEGSAEGSISVDGDGLKAASKAGAGCAFSGSRSNRSYSILALVAALALASRRSRR